MLNYQPIEMSIILRFCAALTQFGSDIYGEDVTLMLINVKQLMMVNYQLVIAD